MEQFPIRPKTPKSNNRECANKIRYGSPKLQEVLRKKCREKMRQNRWQLFNSFRYGMEEPPSEDVQGKLTEILRKELKNMTTKDWHEAGGDLLNIANVPLDPEDALQLENEIIEEEEQWIIEEYFKMLNAEAFVEERENVMCPICQKAVLDEILNNAVCGFCDFHLELQSKTLAQLGELIDNAVKVHSDQCYAIPEFTVLPENNRSLCLICQTCSALSLIS